jgi:dienelactone hydrolase
MKFSTALTIRFVFFSICLLIPVLLRAQPNRLVAAQSPAGTNYWVYTPDGYDDDGTPWAMLVCLHGGSGIVESNDMNVIVTNSAEDGTHLTPPRLIYNTTAQNPLWDHSRPFVIIAPHLKRDVSIALNSQEWPPSLVNEVIEDAIAEYNIDPNKIYMTGISLGAAGTWNYAAAYPDKVAAIVPISGKTPLAEACTFKDIPIWVFHGGNDDQVFPSWSEDMVNAIKSCSGKIYTPKLNLLHTMAHEGWNMVYDGSHKYDIYSWMARFTKGNNGNHAPYVTVGVDRSIVVRTGPIYLTSEYFDSDGSGTLSNVTWSKISGPAISLDNVNGPTLKIPTPVEGTFVFRLTVTDAGGLSSQDDVQIQILAANGAPAITSLALTSGNGSTVYSTLSDDAVINMNTLGVTAFNVRATSSGTTSKVKFSINSDQSTRTHVTSANPYYVRPTNKQWTVTAGTYLLCATPYNGTTEGTSLCHNVTFTDEPPDIIKYYSVGSNISLLSSWNTARDNTGSSPSSFGDANQWFYVQNNVNLPTALTIDGISSRLTVEAGAELSATAGLTANLYVLDGATMRINTASTISQPLYVGATSTYIYEDAVTMIPPLTSAAPVQYGNLILTSTTSNNVKSLTSASGTNTYVRGDFTVNSNVKLQRGSSSSDIIIRGNTYLNGPSENVNCFSIRFNGYGLQNLNLPGGVFSFRNFFVESYLGGGAVVNVVSPTAATIRIATGSIGVRVETKGILNLNGHTLSVESGSINALGQTGQINTTNSSIVLSSTNSSSQPLYIKPLPGANYLKSLEINATGNGTGLFIEDDLYITEKLKITGGVINTNGNLTLVSTPTSTAYVAPITGSPTINGNVNVQRSVPSGTVYRYLAFPVTGATVAGLQQHIPVNGDFDVNSGSSTASLFYYDEASTGWIEYPKRPQTNSASLVIGRGYSTYIFDNTNPEHITVSGSLYTGNFSFNSLLALNTTLASDKGWTLIGNPYAAPVKWVAPTSGGLMWDGTGVNSAIYVRAQDNGTEKFRVYDGQVGSFSGNIASGQSFWIRTTTGSPTLTVKEAAKIESTNVQLYRIEQTDAIYLHFNLSHNNLDDDAFLKFNSSGKVEFDTNRDAVKMQNDFFNLSVLSSDSVATSIKNLCDTLCSQEVALAVQPKSPGTYSLSATGSAFDNLIAQLAISDKFTNKVTPWKEGQAFTFEVTNDPASSHPKRFTALIDNNHSPRPAISFSDGALFSSVTSNIQWMLNGVEIAGATQPEYVPAQDGEYSVRTTYKGCTKTSAGYTFRVTGTNNPLTSEIRLYPNPTRENLTIVGIHPFSSGVEYNITSLAGASLQAGAIEFFENGEGSIRLRSLAQGFYILNIKNGTQRYQLKFSVR